MGIGYGGKTLKETLAERDSLFQKTGYIYGLERLELHEQDPGKMTNFNWRLINACTYARESAKWVAASPVLRTFGECLFMLLAPEGDCVAASLGLIGHVACARVFVKHMINEGFEDNPGIRDGDVFASNDPFYGAPHPADCYTFVPVFYQGELVCWACGMNHIAEVGGITAGSMPAFSPYTFTDGFVFPPMKVGENFHVAKWWEMLWTRRTRLPMMNILDDKARVTGSVMIRDRVLDIVREFGVDYFRRGLRETLERERRRIVRTVQTQAVPGKYEIASFDRVQQKGMGGLLFPEADRNWMRHLPGELHILPEGRFRLDCEGASSQDYFNQNAYEGPVRWGFSLWWLNQIYHSICVNTAMDYQIEVKAPDGCMMNPNNPQLGGALGLNVSGNYAHGIVASCSQAFFARGVLEETYQTVYSYIVYSPSGVLEVGVPWAMTNFSYAGASSRGASAYKDGHAGASPAWNPQGDIGEVEEWELYEPPLVNLGRELVPNSCGHGKYRGGLAYGNVVVAVKPGSRLAADINVGPGASVGSTASGISGGYPAVSGLAVVIHDTNMPELLEKGSYPSSPLEVFQWIKDGRLKAGRIEVHGEQTANLSLKDGDLLLVQSHHGAGWGDPLEREPALVSKDLNETWLTADVAKAIYGVVANCVDGNWEVDEAATAKLRQGMRQSRKQRAVTAREWWGKERQKVLRKEFPAEVGGMYADALKWTKSREKFTQFWHLPGDYGL